MAMKVRRNGVRKGNNVATKVVNSKREHIYTPRKCKVARSFMIAKGNGRLKPLGWAQSCNTLIKSNRIILGGHDLVIMVMELLVI